MCVISRYGSIAEKTSSKKSVFLSLFSRLFFFLFTFIYIPFERKFSQLFDKKNFELPISNGYLAIMRKIRNGIKIFVFRYGCIGFV